MTEADRPAESRRSRPFLLRHARTIIGVLVMLVVVAAGAVKIRSNRHAFGSAWHNVGVWPMVASFVCAVLGVAATYPEWREVLLGLDVRIPVRAGIRVYFPSQLGKYLPGSIWPLVMQMEAGRARGASRRSMLAANLVTLVLGCATGLILACVLLPFSSPGAAAHYWWVLFALPLLLALLHPKSVPLILNRFFVLLRREPVEQRLPLRRSARASAWAAVSFVLFGLHVAFLVGALGGWHATTLPLCIGAISLAVCIGVLAIPVPAGAGVRDAVLTLALAPALSASQCLVVAVGSRVLLIVVDLVLAAVASAIPAGSKG